MMLPARYTTTTTTTTAALACALVLVMFFVPLGRSFAPTATVLGRRRLVSLAVVVVAARRGGLADPEQDEDVAGQRRNNNRNSGGSSWINPSSWTPVDGGFLPNLPRPERRTPAGDSSMIREVTNLADYKKVVVDHNHDKNNSAKLTVVRFYAPWCRACKANQPLFQKMAAAYHHRGSNGNHHVPVQFVQVPLTQETAVLQQGLGIPSLPYGHIYHSDVGLVEERKIGKTNFGTFEKILQSYVQGYCDVTYQEEEEKGSPLRP